MPMLVPALLCLLPVLLLLGALMLFDSYKLVPLTSVLGLAAVGAAVACTCYFVNGILIQALGLGLQSYTRYVSPVVEEALKGLLLVWLIRRHRIGFLIDAAIVGFAIGSGFALAENLYALWRVPDAGLATWMARGFGTAIMHGGTSALFSLISLAILERDERHGLGALLPGFAVAVLLHSAFNHLGRESAITAPLMLVAVSSLLMVAYHLGDQTLGQWLGNGFDADTELLAQMKSGNLGATPAGRYLITLRSRFEGPVRVDLLSYLRLFTELSLRAKGLALMRENGFEAKADRVMREQLAELAYLERSIGLTGLLALHPLLPMRRRALRQLYTL